MSFISHVLLCIKTTQNDLLRNTVCFVLKTWPDMTSFFVSIWNRILPSMLSVPAALIYTLLYNLYRLL